MAVINDLIKQIDDKALRNRLTQEVDRMKDNKKFGLVFEEHLPECTPIYGTSIKKESFVSRKGKKIKDIYFVVAIKDSIATCINKINGEVTDIHVEELVVIAQFGEPIFPTLIPMDNVKNADDDLLWHTLIEADNYHALQLLEYLYTKEVDCIYIDPPYNTGARDWKYNNNYVDAADSWRHSKWLSMMQRRLKIARNLLNPDTGVLVVTIDENEQPHLRVLLKEIFPEAYIQMVTIVINPKGVAQAHFSRVEEYAIFVFMPSAIVHNSDDSMLGVKSRSKKVRWAGLVRSGTDASREDVKNNFYPVLIDLKTKKVIRGESPLPLGEHPLLGKKIDGYDVAWPVRTDLSEGRWMLKTDTLNELIDLGFVSLGGYDERRKTWALTYLSEKSRKQIKSGGIEIIGRDETTGVVDVVYAGEKVQEIKTVWYRSLHNAGTYGSDLLKSIIGKSGSFSFPKSLYSVKDTITSVVKNNKKALIVDFFAGSGTTLNAVNLLNEEDGGSRRCILVTNNELSETETKELCEKGLTPGDDMWEKNGICRAVTWPRTKYSVLGKRDDGSILEGYYYVKNRATQKIPRAFYQIGFVVLAELFTIKQKKQLIALLGKDKLPQSVINKTSRYIVSEKHSTSVLFDDTYADEWLNALDGQDQITDFYIVTSNNTLFDSIKDQIEDLLGPIETPLDTKRPMSDGFKANVEYFKLDFLDKNSVSLGLQFREILPMLWLKSGAVGKRPVLGENTEIPTMLIPDSNNFAILVDETHFAEFAKSISTHKNLSHIFIVTNSEEAFREIASQIKIKDITQIYRDYIDNFAINNRRA